MIFIKKSCKSHSAMQRFSPPSTGATRRDRKTRVSRAALWLDWSWKKLSGKACDIVASMPYFLSATDEASAMAERRLRQLQRCLDRAEARERSRRGAVLQVHSVGGLPVETVT
jgi:hypothetical protein